MSIEKTKPTKAQNEAFHTIMSDLLGSIDEKIKADMGVEDEFEDESKADFLEFITNLSGLNKEYKTEGEAELKAESKFMETECGECAEYDNTPAVNLSSTKDESVVYLQMPVIGFNEDEIEVHTEDDNGKLMLKVSGMPRDDVDDDKHFTYQRKDFSVEPFTADFVMTPEEYKGDINISMEYGILTVAITPVKPKITSKKVF